MSLVIPDEAEAGLLINRTLYLGLTNGLVGHWSFDGPAIGSRNGSVADLLGQGNHGTLTNGPVRAIDKIGEALSFDGAVKLS